MNDEFKEFGNELNNSIPEFKQIKAIEYYQPKEAVVPAAEMALVNEDSSDDSTPKDSEQIQASKDKIADQKERLDRINKFRNTDNTGLNQIEAESAATATSASASSATATTTSSIVSTATLTSGVTIISAAAVIATGGIGGAVFAPKPVINYATYETGSDYLVYEMDVEVSENYNYKIKVSNDTFVEEYPIESSGIQRRIVSGLIPDRRYDVEIICDDGGVFDRSFYSYPCYTDKIKKPSAVFNFTPVLDYEEGVYNLSYEVFLSDYYDRAAETFLQIYDSEEMIVETYELDDKNYFRGELFNLGNNTELSAIAYTTYKGEVIEIGTYGYVCKYPDDFLSIDNMQVSTFDLNSDSVTYDCNFDTGNQITINTNFDNSKDKREYYRLDVYNGNELLDSVKTDEAEVTLNVSPAVVNVTVSLTPIKKVDGKEIEFKPIEKNYSVDPGYFDNKEFRTQEYGYYFEIEYTGPDLENELDLVITTNYSDGTHEKVEESFTGRYDIEGGFNNHTVDDVEDINVQIKYGDILLFDYNHIPNIEDATFGDFELNDDGSINLPYEINIPKYSTLNSVYISFLDGTSQQFELSELSGELLIEELNSNALSGSIIVSYTTRDGVSTEAVIEPQTIDIGAEVETTYYIAHENSYYSYLNIKFDSTLNGKNINLNLIPYVYSRFSNEYEIIDLSSARKYGDYYSIYIDSVEVEEEDPDTGEIKTKTVRSLKYKFDSTGFKTDPVEITIPTGSAFDEYEENINSYSAGYSGEESYINYLKDQNEDGTVSYYFDTMLESGNGKHYGRIEYSYNENGKTYYLYSDFSQGKAISLLNLPDREYDFKYAVYYLNPIDGYYYDSTITASLSSDISYEGKEVSASSAIPLSNPSIVTENENTYILFDVDLDYLISSEPITVTVGGKTYEILYLSSTDTGAEEYEDGYRYFYGEDNYMYAVIVLDNKFSVEFSIQGEYETASINLTSVPSMVLTKFDNLDSSKYQKEIEVNVGEYTGIYDESKFSVSTTTGGSGERNTISVDLSSFSATDSRDKLLIEAYSDGILVASVLGDAGEVVSLNVDPGYTKIKLKITEQKIETFSTRFIDTRLETYTLSYNSFELPDEISFSEEIIVSNVSVNVTDNSYLISVTADNFDDYVIEACQVYNDGTKSDVYIGEKGQTSYNKNEDVDFTNISYIEVRISEYAYWGNNIARSIYKIYLTPEITDFTYTDNDEIVIPYTYSPDGLEIDTTESEVTVANQIFAFGEDITLTSISSNEVEIQFNITATTTSGIKISYNFKYVYELSADHFEVDYYVSSFSTSYYENGYSFGGDVYRVNMTVQPYLGIYAINDTNFEMNVTKSGSPLVDAPPTVLVTDLVVSGTNLVGKSYAIISYDNDGTYTVEYNINGVGDTITFGALTTNEDYAGEFTSSIVNATIERSTTDGVLNLFVSTEFDQTEYENGYYVISLLDADGTVIAKSTNLTTTDYTFESLPKDFYKIQVVAYRVIDGTIYQSRSYTLTERDYLDDIYVYDDSVRLEMSNSAFTSVGDTVSVTIDGVTYTTDTSGNPLKVGSETEVTYQLADGISLNYYQSYRTITVNVSNYNSLTITLINSNGGDDVSYVIK